jgi:hypothetical protein
MRHKKRVCLYVCPTFGFVVIVQKFVLACGRLLRARESERKGKRKGEGKKWKRENRIFKKRNAPALVAFWDRGM